MGNLRVWSLVLLGACGGVAEDPSDPTDPPEDVPRTCIVTSSDGERLVAELLGRDRPSTVEWLRDGALYSSWSYDYDAANRLVMQRQDHGGPGGSVPDGIEDSARTIEHSATGAIVRWMGLPSQVVSETATYTVDASDRVVAYQDNGGGMRTFTLGAGGRLDSSHVEAVDVDTQQAYTTDTVYAYDGNGRLSARTVTDSRSGSPTTLTFEHEVSTARLVVHVQTLSPRMSYAYDYDAQERLIGAAVDEDGDTTMDWITELTYAGDGSVTTAASRGGVVGRTHTFSAGCDYAPIAPGPVHGWTRPGAEWLYVQPAIPFAYQ